MKKMMQNVFIRALCVLILGVLLIVYSGEVSRWIVMASGVLFILPGLVGIISYWRRDKQSRQFMLYPLIALGSILFGVVQLALPDLFFEALRYVLASAILILALLQVYTVWNIRSGGVRASWVYFLFPLGEMAAALYVIFYGKFADNDPLPLLIIGVTFIVYSVVEMWTEVLVKRSIVKVKPETAPAAEPQQLPDEGNAENK